MNFKPSQMLSILDEFRTVNWLEIDRQLKCNGILPMFQFVKKEKPQAELLGVKV